MLKAEIEELRDKLNIATSKLGSNDYNYKFILDISVKLDKLILEYIKNPQ